jgi:hypothetical protein
LTGKVGIEGPNRGIFENAFERGLDGIRNERPSKAAGENTMPGQLPLMALALPAPVSCTSFLGLKSGNGWGLFLDSIMSYNPLINRLFLHVSIKLEVRS